MKTVVAKSSNIGYNIKPTKEIKLRIPGNWMATVFDGAWLAIYENNKSSASCFQIILLKGTVKINRGRKK